MDRLGNILLATAVSGTVALFFIVPGIRVGINAIEQASLTLATKGEPMANTGPIPAHVSAVLKALGLNNRTEAALWWRENGGEQ